MALQQAERGGNSTTFRPKVQERQYGGINGRKTGMIGRGGSWSWHLESSVLQQRKAPLTLARLTL